MGKKRSRAHQVSKGERRCVNKNLLKSIRLAYLSSDERIRNQIAAWRRGKNVMLTIPNPDKKNTKERMIRIPAIEHWGYPRQMQLKMR